jgi:hypothetical protein
MCSVMKKPSPGVPPDSPKGSLDVRISAKKQHLKAARPPWEGRKRAGEFPGRGCAKWPAASFSFTSQIIVPKGRKRRAPIVGTSPTSAMNCGSSNVEQGISNEEGKGEVRMNDQKAIKKGHPPNRSRRHPLDHGWTQGFKCPATGHCPHPKAVGRY